MLLWAWCGPNCAAILKQWVLYLYANSKEEIDALWLSLKIQCPQNQEPVFSKDGSRFFLTIPVKQGGQGDFHHIAMFTKSVGAVILQFWNTPWSSCHSLAFSVLTLCLFFFKRVFIEKKKSQFVFSQFRSDQNDVRHLTSGNWEVTKILAYDEGEQTM